MRKKILFIILLLFFGKVSALTYNGCDYSDVSRLRSIVSNINISYDYHIENNIAYFDITLNNITNDIYFRDVKSNITYKYENTYNGEITIKNYRDNSSGSFKFYSNLNNCMGTLLDTKYYSLPIYNTYYENEMCKDISNFSMCKKWVKKSISYDEFISGIEEYKKVESIEPPKKDQKYIPTTFDKVITFYVNYYYYFFAGIIIICLIIIFVKSKKDKFDL